MQWWVEVVLRESVPAFTTASFRALAMSIRGIGSASDGAPGTSTGAAASSFALLVGSQYVHRVLPSCNGQAVWHASVSMGEAEGGRSLQTRAKPRQKVSLSLPGWYGWRGHNAPERSARARSPRRPHRFAPPPQPPRRPAR